MPMELNENTGTVRCMKCIHFRYFESAMGHISPSALGICKSDPWDGNRGQWPTLAHPCRAFEEPASQDGGGGG
ncbi:MAG: hypothetical protein COZ70_10060 [Deltaproteobacteria bacterium CG_4_8_14_3_um_filter_51_11]|nr:MAG: hypothetical protein AUK25_10890 [Desulfobacteraceae bacterium CG2_30_51_40]PIP47315.1 MAG: hypothetical protein COX16_04990 [Deltaproteobacteria bacterium CG23_combo_of_CG06-09_8_20_14_all_51_20]PIV98943.1 MAG: hypothetical protein COW41_09165 [Deltaproteobacteria bacterium CG17_big_fil_post_rev_8_21_14_2_50_51_6]PIX19230.1 MAG: hypothetical protein COZ70_10060 [Deltaproteobacteria bacterium CG_4_8_14_3_um_filter_51_11]PIY25623.1 MAG: hypothetical protein COZ11_04800 [Deltaproteobacter